MPADLIITGGTIRTMAGGATADAVAVDDGRILEVGFVDDVMRHRGSHTDMVDLAGRCLLPGFVEPHTHPDMCGVCYSWLDVSGFNHRSDTEVETALTAEASRRADGEWIFAFGLDAMLTDDLSAYDRSRLDRIAPDNPLVVMIQSMHTLWVNSAALRAAGLDDSSPDPEFGGSYGRDAAGHLNGRVEEQAAMGPFLIHADMSPGHLETEMWRQYQRYADVGLTTLGLAGATVPTASFELFKRFANRPDVPQRVVGYLRHQQVESLGISPGDGDDKFRVQGVKLWYDGSPYTGTMLLDEPYLESELCCCTLGIAAGTTGYANFDPADLVEILSGLASDGWQVLTHAQGDRGCREILDLYTTALGERARSDHRWRLEHCLLISGHDLRRAKSIGVSPSFHVDHVHWYGPELRDDILGSDRCDRVLPIATAIGHDHRVSLHADSPMYPPGPLHLARTAVTRLTRKGEVLGAREAISVEQALRAVTIDAAWQLRLDDKVGSIEPGKFADFVSLDADPVAVAAADIDKIGVDSTWLAGVPVSGSHAG